MRSVGLFIVDGIDQVELLLNPVNLPFVAVTGDDHERLESIVSRAMVLEAVQNDHPELGQRAVHSDGSASFGEYVIRTARRYSLFSGDQPLLTGTVVHRVIRAFSENFHPKTIVVPHYRAELSLGKSCSLWFSLV